ncbi:carbonic anhydrase [Psychrobacillus sp. FJAT-21963]|uniref:carbonic anhydrase n=1 Tax=Psychrobacillus sp. FJAT-21963 TaxID=1712028 RepID=UPI00209E7FB6|nr:carbonic anhydrase [Psychrobacillus sp. FJAT-21963]
MTTKYPNKKLVVLSCMDSRLVELLPKSMNLCNGDVKIVKSSGAIVNHPFGSIMRSILVALYELKAEEVFIVGHNDCGMSAVDPDSMIEHMKERGITIPVHGLVMEPKTGYLDLLSDGNAYIENKIKRNE